MRRGGIVALALLLLVPARAEAGSTTKTIKAPYGSAITCFDTYAEQERNGYFDCDSQAAEVARQTGAFTDALLMSYAGPNTFDTANQFTAIYSSVKMSKLGSLTVSASFTDGARQGNAQYCLIAQVAQTIRFSCADPPKAVTTDVASGDVVYMGVMAWTVTPYPLPVAAVAQGANAAVLNSITYTLKY